MKKRSEDERDGDDKDDGESSDDRTVKKVEDSSLGRTPSTTAVVPASASLRPDREDAVQRKLRSVRIVGSKNDGYSSSSSSPEPPPMLEKLRSVGRIADAEDAVARKMRSFRYEKEESADDRPPRDTVVAKMRSIRSNERTSERSVADKLRSTEVRVGESTAHRKMRGFRNEKEESADDRPSRDTVVVAKMRSLRSNERTSERSAEKTTESTDFEKEPSSRTTSKVAPTVRTTLTQDEIRRMQDKATSIMTNDSTTSMTSSLVPSSPLPLTQPDCRSVGRPMKDSSLQRYVFHQSQSQRDVHQEPTDDPRLSIADLANDSSLYGHARADEIPIHDPLWTVGDLRRACTLRNVVVVLVLALLIVVPTSLLLTKGRGGGDDDDDVDGLRRALLSAGVVSPSVLDDPASPQSRALAYASRTETADAETWSALVVAYGIGADDALPDPESSSKTRGSGRPHCEWDWIDCDDDDRIAGLDLSDRSTSSSATIASEIALLAGLRTLDLSDNSVEGTVPDALWTSNTNLTKLDLSYNPTLRATIPPSVTNLASLIRLDLTSCDLAGTLPTELGSLPRLQTLALGSNPNLEGTLPTELGRLERLRELVVARCRKITGPIPVELFRLGALEELYLHFNDLAGTLPTEIGAADALRSLHLHGNPKLGGTIPTEIGAAVGLRELLAQDTDLEGLIPVELLFSRPSDLVLVDLSRTSVSGAIPNAPNATTTGNDGRLESLNVCDTRVRSTVPEALCALHPNLSVLRDDDDDNDCDCCEPCPN